LRRISSNPAQHPGSYELYLRALHAFRRFDSVGNTEALGLLDQALKLDPTFAPALELAGLSHTFRCISGWSDDVAATRKLGQEFVRRALQHNPHDPRVLGSAAMAATFLGDDLDMAARMMDRALAINPNSVTHLILRGWIKLLRGDAASGLAEIENVTDLNPQVASSAFALLLSGFCYFALRRFDDALRAFREAAHQGQDSNLLRFGVTLTLAHLGLILQAKQEYRKMNPVLVPYYSGLFRGSSFQEILRSGLDLVDAG
jgi:tetratricopeptide (TPR) repeat protein